MTRAIKKSVFFVITICPNIVRFGQPSCSHVWSQVQAINFYNSTHVKKSCGSTCQGFLQSYDTRGGKRRGAGTGQWGLCNAAANAERGQVGTNDESWLA